MAKEIERKYLVVNDRYKLLAQSSHRISQGYLSANPEATVRVRVYDDKGYLTVKSKNIGTTRGEWEYEIPLDDALEMLNLCNPSSVIRKTRYNVGRWEVDAFEGRLAGLTLAEIELAHEGESFDIPSFIGQEVTGDPRYYNSNLALSQL